MNNKIYLQINYRTLVDMQVVASAILSGGMMYYLGVTASQPTPKQAEKVQADVKEQKAVIDIIRNIQMNEYTHIIYSTLHKTPLVVHEKLDPEVIKGDTERGNFFLD